MILRFIWNGIDENKCSLISAILVGLVPVLNVVGCLSLGAQLLEHIFKNDGRLVFENGLIEFSFTKKIVSSYKKLNKSFMGEQ